MMMFELWARETSLSRGPGMAGISSALSKDLVLALDIDAKKRFKDRMALTSTTSTRTKRDGSFVPERPRC